MPSVTPYQAMWELPFVTVSYYVVQAMRKAGVKGIGRPEKSQKLWRRFYELNKDEIDARKAVSGKV